MYGKHGIMLDLETLGTEPGAGVLEVGFCPFPYYALISLEELRFNGHQHILTLADNLKHRMAVSPSTIEWWENEHPSKLLPNASKLPMQAALALVASDLNELWKQGIRDVWAKPSLFDVPILQAAMDAVNIERPICLRPENFRHWQCFATLRRIATVMAPELNQKAEFMQKPTHTAIEDAVDQAVQANIILNVLPAWRQSHLKLPDLENALASARRQRDEYLRGVVEMKRKYDNLRARKKRGR